MELVVLNIDISVINDKNMLIKKLKTHTKFISIYSDSLITILTRKSMDEISQNIYSYIRFDRDKIVVEVDKLSTLAKSRMISNFDDEYPELSLQIMSANDESKLMKIWRKHD